MDLRWLGGGRRAGGGFTLGVPWPRGEVPSGQLFTIQADGRPIPTQTWPLAYWPDGSLKWTGHAVATDAAAAKTLRLVPRATAIPARGLTVHQDHAAVHIDTGTIRCLIPLAGEHLIQSIHCGSQLIVSQARLVCLLQDRPDLGGDGQITQSAFVSAIEKVTVEQSGPVRAVVRIEGKHARGDRSWLPFTIRLYFYAGSESVRLMHTFIFDGDENRDFIRGLGVRFDVPMPDAPHDRHVRFAGEADGLWAEAVKNLSGLRRDPGKAFIEKQLAGEACPPIEQMSASVRDKLHLVPAWDSFSLAQNSADAYTIRKKTAGQNVCWIDAAQGGRTSGVGYIGGASGGAAFGVRDFWQKHPAQLDIRHASTDAAQVTMWLWSPSALAMDLRFYHDGMGMDTHARQLQGLEITYEDYEPGFATPHGIARTSEMMLWALPATPSRQRLTELASATREPAVLVCPPEHYLACDVFGGMWSLPDRANPRKARIEDQLDWYVDYYRKQVEQHRWYGFWDYGDFMHTYDANRHCWRYDVGGFAWDNSELSPDLWLWYSFLRTGDAATFCLAEAMTRHTGEVDVYHLGRFAGLGTRHNVRHWGCSAKQLRISTATYRRFYYYLTADERTGDLMRELVDCDRTFLNLDPIRKLRKEAYEPRPRALAVGFGTDWGSLASALLTEWERTGDTRYRDKLLNSMKCIGGMANGFFSAGSLYDLWPGYVHPWLASSAPDLLAGFSSTLDGISAAVPQLNWHVTPQRFPFNGQWVLLAATLTAVVFYVGLSALTYRRPFDLDRMLHRGRHADGAKLPPTTAKRRFNLGMLIGITPEFTRSDKVISISLFGYRFLWFLIFAAITTWNLIRPWPERWWVSFFHATSVVLPLAIALTVTVWFTWGGVRDLRQLFVRLGQVRVDEDDDGTVAEGEKAVEAAPPDKPSISAAVVSPAPS